MSSFFDNFARADSASLGANYDQPIGVIGISGEHAENQTSSAECTAYWSANATTADLYGEAVIVRLGAGSIAGVGLVLRKNATPATQTYYLFDAGFVPPTTGDSIVAVYRCVAGAYTQLASVVVTLDPNVQYTLRGEISGTSPVHLVLKLDGVTQITFDDSDGARITTGQRAGLRGFGAVTGTCNWDDFSWGDLSAAATAGGLLLSDRRNRLVIV